MAPAVGLFVEGYTGTLRNCIVLNNEATPTLVGYGGGMQMQTFGKVRIIDCQFSSNTISASTSSYGGGAYIDNFSTYDTVFISNSRFGGNILGGLGEGAGIYIKGNTFLIDSSHFDGNNSGNDSESKAGGMACFAKNMVISNSDFYYNTANNACALRFNSNAECTYKFYNCIIDGNGESQDAAAIEAFKPSLHLEFYQLPYCE
jgi:hypothetical protein